MPRIAFTTFAIMHAPYGNSRVRGFEDLTPPVFSAAEHADGFIGRAKEIDDRSELTNFERDWGRWGKFCVPFFYDGGRETASDTRASTLSLWSDIASVRRFAYSGIHAAALRQREDWFREPRWPSYAMWWVGDDDIPCWSDAVARLEHLHVNGASAFAFDFKRSYNVDGSPAISSRASQPSEQQAGNNEELHP